MTPHIQMFGGIWYWGGSFPPLSSYLREINPTVGYMATIGDTAPGIRLEQEKSV